MNAIAGGDWQQTCSYLSSFSAIVPLQYVFFKHFGKLANRGVFCKPSIGLGMRIQNLTEEFPNHPRLKADVSPREEGLIHFNFAAVPTGLSTCVQWEMHFPREGGMKLSQMQLLSEAFLANLRYYIKIKQKLWQLSLNSVELIMFRFREKLHLYWSLQQWAKQDKNFADKLLEENKKKCTE